MSNIVIRSRKGKDSFFGGIEMTDEKRQQIREHLKSIGVRVERLQPLIWPEDAVSASQEHMYAPWRFTTKSDILRKRRKRMEDHLWRKREYGVTNRRPLYVWVFWCPGIGGFAYRGWWLYLIGRGISSGKYLEQDTEKVSRLMELFPLVEPTLYGSPRIKEWKAEFVKRYQRGFWCGKPQGKAPIWAEIQGTNIKRILGRAEWPQKKTA